MKQETNVFHYFFIENRAINPESVSVGDVLESFSGSKYIFKGKDSDGNYVVDDYSEDEPDAYCFGGAYSFEKFSKFFCKDITLENNKKEFNDEFNKLLSKYNLKFHAVVDQWNDIEITIRDSKWNTYFYKKIVY